MDKKQILNEKDAKIKQLEDAIRERDNTIVKFSYSLEATRTLCQEHRRSTEALNEVVIKLQAIRTGIKMLKNNETQNITDYVLSLVDKTSLTITDHKSSL